MTPEDISGGVIVERCCCGHYQSQHLPQLVTAGKGKYYACEGHGPCEECSCRQYRWDGSHIEGALK